MDLDAHTHERVDYPDELLANVRPAATRLQERLDAAGLATTGALIRRMIAEGVAEARESKTAEELAELGATEGDELIGERPEGISAGRCPDACGRRYPMNI